MEDTWMSDQTLDELKLKVNDETQELIQGLKSYGQGVHDLI
jgi:hypothetical protein